MRNLIKIIFSRIGGILFGNPKVRLVSNLFLGIFFLALIFRRRLLFNLLDLFLNEVAMEKQTYKMVGLIQKITDISHKSYQEFNLLSLFFLLCGLYFIYEFFKQVLPLRLQSYKIRKSRVKPLLDLFFAFVLFGLIFWAQTLFKTLEHAFGDLPMAKRIPAVVNELQAFEFSFEMVEYAFSEGKAGAIWAVILFSALGLYKLISFGRHFFDFRLQLSVRKKGLFIMEKGLINWNEISSLRIAEKKINNPDGADYIDEYLYIKFHNMDNVSIHLDPLDFSVFMFEKYLDRFNTNEKLSLDL